VAAARLAAPGPDVPVGATPAHLARVPTPAPAPLVAVVRGRYAVDRGVRRARAACVVVAAVTYTAGRAWQLRDPSRDVPTPLALAILLSLLGALLLPAVLRLLGRHAPLRHPLPADATVTRNDTGRLGDRFPHVPLVRTGPRGGRVQTLSVDGRAGDRLWWATVQKGNTYDRSGVPSRRYRTTCWVWLPGGDLPCVSVCGRDLSPVAEWFGEGLPLESWEFNEAFLVRAAAEDRRAAVALLTPRLMELLGTHLPDGAQLGVVADVLFVVVERCVREDELAPVVSFVLAAADLLPRYLLAPEGARPPG
jgi:hypothetical protein